MCTLIFLKNVLSGEKKLLKVSDTAGIPDIPKMREFNAHVIWNDIKGDAQIRQYFPEIYLTSDRTPQREYMFKVS